MVRRAETVHSSQESQTTPSKSSANNVFNGVDPDDDPDDDDDDAETTLIDVDVFRRCRCCCCRRR